MGAEGARRSMGTKAAKRKILSTLHPSTVLKPTLTLTPTPTQTLPLPLPLRLAPSLALAQSKIWYWDRAGGERNIVQETSTRNEVRIGKWMRAAQKALKMSCIHPFGHHNYTTVIFGKPWF